MRGREYMTFEEFQYYIEENILNDWMDDAVVSIHMIRKNNGIKQTGLCIKREEEAMTPTVYLDDYYEYYLKGEELDEIIKRIREEYEWAMTRVASYHLHLSHFEDIKKRIIYRLVNYEKNQDILMESPCIRLYDLAVTFRWLAYRDEIGISTALITNQEMELWDVSLHELLLAAQDNTQKMFPPRIISMDDFLKKMGRKIEGGSSDITMYIMTNEQQINGATVLIYGEPLQLFAKKMKTDFYILPSSIHEMILVPVEFFDEPDDLFEMVREANRTIVSAGDVLSDSVYYYNFRKNRIIPLTK